MTLIAYGAMVDVALRAAEALAGEASVEVLDLRTVWPLDEEAILGSLARTSRALCAAGGELVARRRRPGALADRARGLRAARRAAALIAAPIAPVPFAPELEDAYIPSVDRVVEEVRRLGAY